MAANGWPELRPGRTLCFGRREVVAGAGADLQVFRVVANDTHFNFVVATGIRARGRIADGVLRVQFAAYLVDGFFNGAVLEGGEVCAAGRGGGDFKRVIPHLIVNVLDGPDGGGQQIALAVAV